jgi:ATP-dependent protease Clp ATPase subunit
MFNFPSEKNIEKVVVDENVVKNKEQPLKLLRKKIAN